MRSGETLSVWLSTEDRRRLEEGCAIAGYSRLSKYVRDRVLGRLEYVGGRVVGAEWQHWRLIEDRLAQIEQVQGEILEAVRHMLAIENRRADPRLRPPGGFPGGGSS